MTKWLFDRVVALLALALLLPALFLVALAVVVDSPGPPFFRQVRVGRQGKHFKLWKFRTMHTHSEAAGRLTVGSRDPRITRVGYYLRKYKVDELPQLINVLAGHMSFVGPRPEVPEFVALYTPAQCQVLSVLPGITDYASLRYFHESELLAASADPQYTYIHEIMPAKLRINLEYMARRSFCEDLRIMAQTVGRILGVVGSR
jgi:lipopolysaccharide/colanic/teichoic acid biosynthesis glycosyltransferase